jgi:hypothetical protein
VAVPTAEEVRKEYEKGQRVMAGKRLSLDRRNSEQAMNCIGSLIFERGLRGDLDVSVSTRSVGEATTITTIQTGS